MRSALNVTTLFPLGESISPASGLEDRLTTSLQGCVGDIMLYFREAENDVEVTISC
jgi:hypothetical protein